MEYFNSKPKELAKDDIYPENRSGYNKCTINGRPCTWSDGQWCRDYGV